MNQRYFVGANAKKSSEGISLPAISKIILIVDEENAFEAGNDTGYALKIYCPYGTQQMADDLLAQASGFVYTGYSAKSAQLPPEAELGDGVTVGTTYGMLAFRKFSFTPKLTEDIEAPLEKEVEHEYSYEGTLTKEVKRKLTLGANYYGTSITRTHGLEIKHYDASGNPTTRVTLNSETLAFYNANGGKAFYYDSTSGEFKISSSIVVGLDEYEKKAELSTDISTYIDTTAGTAKIVSACAATYLSKASAEAQYETIAAAAQIAQSVSDVQSEISLSASYGSGTIGSNVRALLQLVSNADTSSIEIKADKINFTGVTTFVRPGDNISKLTNNVGYQTSSGVTTIIGNTVTTDYIEALNIRVGAAQITGKLTASQINANNITASGVNISGTITASDGKIGDLNITDGGLVYGVVIDNIATGVKITTDSIWVKNGYLHSGVVGAWWFNSSKFYGTWQEAIISDVPQKHTAYLTPEYAGYRLHGTSEINTCKWRTIVSTINADTSGSDIRIKKNIEPYEESYEILFDNLKPCRYKYIDGTSDRYHTGFVAQEVVEALKTAGLTTQDFAAVTLRDPGTDYECWHLRRDEFVALNTWQIQKLKARVAELEDIVTKLQEG